jgi:hypothetical protein
VRLGGFVASEVGDGEDEEDDEDDDCDDDAGDGAAGQGGVDVVYRRHFFGGQQIKGSLSCRGLCGALDTNSERAE